jgi:hypothetical protein
MKSTARCWAPPAVASLIAMLWLRACAMGSLDTQAPCPPVMASTTAEQARATNGVDTMAEGALVTRMLGDCAVLRGQACACA